MTATLRVTYPIGLSTWHVIRLGTWRDIGLNTWHDLSTGSGNEHEG
jgi:hypothetical protein